MWVVGKAGKYEVINTKVAWERDFLALLRNPNTIMGSLASP